MKLGLMTACLPDLPLEQVAQRARGLGLEALEVAAWPREPLTNHGYSPCHIDVWALSEAHQRSAKVVEERAGRIREWMKANGLEISALGFYANNLHQDRAMRDAIHDHLLAVIEAAAVLGVGMVGTMIGRDVSDTFKGSLAQAEDKFPRFVSFASERGVEIVVENCPMPSWDPDWVVGNLAYSPELWEWMGRLGIGLNYDPSHLLPLGIDPVEAIHMAGDQIKHVQAKDAEVLPDRCNRTGFLPSVFAEKVTDARPYHHRMPGNGRVNRPGVIGALDSIGYDGVVSIEHEDPGYEGSQRKVLAGLVLARDTLRPLVG